MKKILPIFFLTLLIGISLWAIAPAVHAATTDPGVTTIEGGLGIKKPVIEINIPNLNFSDAAQNVDAQGYLHLPWIGEYIAAIYKFGMVAASILAVIMIIISGARMMVSAGGEEKNAAIKRLGQALIGLVICWGSYAILYNINPELVQFQALKVKYVQPDNLATASFGGHWPSVLEGGGTTKPLSATIYDDMFQSFASCVGIDWKLLKVIAFKESGLNPNSGPNPSGFSGLFQTKLIYCQELLGKMKLDVNLCNNPGIKDPAVNTAMGTSLLNTGLDSIKKYWKDCPALSPAEVAFILYFNHANGPGGLCATRFMYGCDVNKWPDVTWGTTPAELDALKKCMGTNKELVGQPVFRGAPYKYAHETADLAIAQGISSVNVAVDRSKCPSKITSDPAVARLQSSVSRVGSGVKILAVGDSITANTSSYADLLGATQKIAVKGMSTSWMLQQVKATDLTGFTHLSILGGVNDLSGDTTAAQVENNLRQIYQLAKTKNPKIKIIAITCTPWQGFAGYKGNKYVTKWTPEKQEQTKLVNEWIKSKAGGNDYAIDFYTLLKDNQEQMKPAYDSGDHLHPSNIAHRVLGNQIMTQVFGSP